MVIRALPTTDRRQAAALTTEILVALGILALVVLPLAYGLRAEASLCRAYYQRAIAVEIVDGEMEALAAGEWRAFSSGRQPYAVRAATATNLPPGQFMLSIEGNRCRLEWVPAGKSRLGKPIVREVTVR